MSPSGRFLYVAGGAANSVAVYTVHPVTGVLAAVPGSPIVAGSYPFGVAVDRAGRFVYVTNYFSGSVRRTASKRRRSSHASR